MGASQWPVFPESPIVDMRKPDWEAIASHAHAASIEFSNLSPTQVPGLVEIGFANLRALSLRHLRASDLNVLVHFPQLERFRVWQSNPVTSLNGLEFVQDLKVCELTELGPLSTITPLAAHTGLTALCISSGIWKWQHLSGDLSPLAELTKLRHLILVVRGPTDLTPLLGLPELEWLHFPPALAPVLEVARLAARYPIWAIHSPWLVPFNEDRDGCSRCGSVRTFLFLERKKRIWCPRCDAARLNKVLANFNSLIERFRPPH